jgi:hypothetical protein
MPLNRVVSKERPKFRKELPEKYYLDHFNEFIHFITQ